MTTQEAAQGIWDHFIVNKGKPSGGNFCYYRDGKGNKCAVGCLIPDKLYEPAMDNGGDGYAVDDLLYHFPSMRDLFAEVPERFLADCQVAHDQWARHCWQTGPLPKYDILRCELLRVFNKHGVAIDTKGA